MEKQAQALPAQYNRERSEEVKLANIRTHLAAEHLLGSPTNRDVPLRVNCECGRAGCTQLIEIPFGELKSARRKYRRMFIILPQHAIDGIDRVAFLGATYVLVDRS